MASVNDMEPAQPSWIGRDGWFRTIESYEGVADLMTNEAMHADLVGTFEGLGLRSGPVWECMSAALLSLNGAEHKRLRSIVGPWFTPRSVEAVRTFAARDASDRVHALTSAAEVDLVATYATPYVVAVTGEFIGLPPEDTERYMPLVALVNSRHAEAAQRLDESLVGLMGLVDYACEIFARTLEGEDRVLGKIAALVANGTLTERFAATFIAGLLAAGNDPTINQVALSVDVLSEHPDMWDAMASAEVDIASIVEEMLRYRPTNEQVSRRVAESFVYDGVSFTEGEHVVMRLATANHDPERFPRPDDFDPVDNRGSHLAFGFGAHYCLGAALARLQLQEALRALTTNLECPTVIEREDKPPGGIVGPSRMVITVTKRGRSAG